MEWYNYVAAFFSAVFVSNAIPHFVNGTSGDKFPTPFSKPPGRGLSSPVINVIWAAINIVIAYVLYRVSHMNWQSAPAISIALAGFILKALGAAFNFQKKEKA
ncbi:hypothetical protein MTO98_09845 [Mucilaginibacter sp. SMC90]|uniref:hypothetical protein n=1 Tax=Mucilaginibacter sp. SMC90 TaxID=2929803 RepID=UPI001FB31A53|nr:hypothetical protein [Mucilaginibacter sp. SMC90]UOE51380.1 hypothetical protein MTO98_09845 [Mucilaginibacter sp. SMC90]